jgi:nucleotide-binding universal stress UspA family protein
MKILLAYDGSPSADAAIEDLRKAGISGPAEIRVACVEDGGLSGLIEANRLAGITKERIRSYFPSWDVSFQGLVGSPATMILKAAERWHPDLLVVGSHGRSGLGRLLLGSVSLNLVHHSTCPVRVARTRGAPDPGAPLRLVIGTDGSKEAEAAILCVAARSWPEKTEAQVVAVVQSLVPVVTDLEASTYAHETAFQVIAEADEQERARLQSAVEASAKVLRSAGLIVTSIVLDGEPGRVISSAAESWNADAVFVGARGHGRVERMLLGSVSTHVVTHVPCSVEIVRQGRLLIQQR